MYSSTKTSKQRSRPQFSLLGVRGVLAHLFRMMVMTIIASPQRWALYMLRFLDDPRNGIPNNASDRSSARGNLNKELERPDMTWPVFRKGILFLNPAKAIFRINLHMPNRTVRRYEFELPNALPIEVPMEDREITPVDKLWTTHTDDELAAFYRRILKGEQVDKYVWGSLMLRYVDNPRNGVPNTQDARSSVRGNLNRELRSSVMTWMSFDKGLKFLNPLYYVAEIEFHTHENTKHSFALKRPVATLTPEQEAAANAERDEHNPES